MEPATKMTSTARELIEADDVKSELLAVRYPHIKVYSSIAASGKRGPQTTWLADVDVSPGELEFRTGETAVDLAVRYLRNEGASPVYRVFKPSGWYQSYPEHATHYYTLKDFTLKELEAVFDKLIDPAVAL